MAETEATGDVKVKAVIAVEVMDFEAVKAVAEETVRATVVAVEAGDDLAEGLMED